MQEGSNPSGPLQLSCDAVVVGSGAGGGPVAALLSQAGLRVVVLEKGSFTPTEELNQKVGGSCETARVLPVSRECCHIRPKWFKKRCPSLAGGSREVLDRNRSRRAALIHEVAACIVQAASRLARALHPWTSSNEIVVVADLLGSAREDFASSAVFEQRWCQRG